MPAGPYPFVCSAPATPSLASSKNPVSIERVDLVLRENHDIAQNLVLVFAHAGGAREMVGVVGLAEDVLGADELRLVCIWSSAWAIIAFSFAPQP
jgi:hypothetical protein